MTPGAIYHGSGEEEPIKRATYRDAGVDIDAGNAFVRRIAPLAAKTARPGAEAGLGGFGALFDPRAAGFRDPILVAATDGVGTKLRLAIDAGRLDTVGIDLVAMCVNDLVVQGAEPLFFLDYYAAGALDAKAAAEVVGGIARGCAEAGCALIGGETAEMPGMYAAGDFDLAGFAVGAAERGDLLTGEGVADGDVILGLASSGLHSNGFSLVRRLLAEAGLALDAKAPFAPDTSVAAALLEPTRIYAGSCLKAVRAGKVRALAHITGGGLIENIPRVLPAGLRPRLDAAAWPLPPVFSWLRETGPIEAGELARTFNCGIGMAVIAGPGEADAVTRLLEKAGETVHRIGEVVAAGTAGTETGIVGAEAAWRG